MPDYVVITPVRNEGRFLPQTIDSFEAQTVKPRRWVIVNDGSTDDTAGIIDAAASRHAWSLAVHRTDRGFRKPGGGVVEAFYDGYRLVRDEHWDYIAKFDGDLAFAADYFERCLEMFARDPRLGIGGGMICHLVNGQLVGERNHDPRFHVRGATKIYRAECWRQIGGLLVAPGWDTVDELKTNMLGWVTRTFPELKVQQLKHTGSADGTWGNWVKNGQANYATAYHPLFMAAKCLKRLAEVPYLVGATGLACGYASGYLKRLPRINDAKLVRYIHNQQIRRLTLRSSIWD